MHRSILIAAALGFLGGLFYLKVALRYSLGTAGDPGPGVYPLLVGSLFLIGAVGTGLEAALARSVARIEWPVDSARWRVALMALASGGYGLLLPYLGHPIAASAVSFLVLWIMGMRQWLWMVILSGVLGLGTAYLFISVLGVPLPSFSLFD